VSTEEEDRQWVRITAEGFAAAETAAAESPIDAETVDAISRMMQTFRHPAINRYLAWVDGEAAGGAATFVHRGVLGIFGTGTHPRFRRRGVQRALVGASMAAAPAAELAIATTAPGSVSQRTFERVGFQVIYTRVVFVKPFHQTSSPSKPSSS
jgi:GNAT superfamily N-acetyltransferase